MIILTEQLGYKRDDYIQNLKEEYFHLLEMRTHSKSFIRKGNEEFRYHIEFDKIQNRYKSRTSYHAGVDWVIDNKVSVYVEPKMNSEYKQVNFVGMLMDALKAPENLNYLDGLCEINFDKPPIEIDQSKDILSPVLVALFLNVVKNIVRKGLKKSYYQKQESLYAKVKGKIAVSKTIGEQIGKKRFLNTVCQFEEFGVNTHENKILKKALQFCTIVLNEYQQINSGILKEILSYVTPAFENVTSEVNVQAIKDFKPNPLYKEYKSALDLALLILKRYGYTVANVHTSGKIMTPPFWIDMSKLFEMYVFKKLKDIFPGRNELTYHKKFDYLEPDFIVKSSDKEYRMVVDAKYKPKYNDENIKTDDVRQVAGYARLHSVASFLGISNEIIDCLIIYSHQDCNDKLTLHDLKRNPEEKYIQLYKIGIKLPEVS